MSGGWSGVWCECSLNRTKKTPTVLPSLITDFYCGKRAKGGALRPVHTRDPINPCSLPLLKNGRIGNERALIGESVCWSKIQRGLVGPALRGRGEREKFFNRLKKWSGMIPLSTGRLLSGCTAWWSSVQRRLVIF